MYHLSFYVPESHLEIVKSALFDAGAGQIGPYSHCAWQVKGEGQFMPLSGSQPFIGQIDQVEVVSEYKVEMVCRDEVLSVVIQALLAAHPYETPAYCVIQCVT